MQSASGSINIINSSDSEHPEEETQKPRNEWLTDSVKNQDNQDQNEQNGEDVEHLKERKTFSDPVMPEFTDQFISYDDFMASQEKSVNYSKARKIYNLYRRKWQFINGISQFKNIKDFQSVKDKYSKKQSLIIKNLLNQIAQKRSTQFKEFLDQNNISLEINERVLINNYNQRPQILFSQHLVPILYKKRVKIIYFQSMLAVISSFSYLYILVQINLNSLGAINRESPYLFFPSVPNNISFSDLLCELDRIDINIIDLAISEPQKFKEYQRLYLKFSIFRTLWVGVSNYKEVQKVLNNEIIIDKVKLDCVVAQFQNHWFKVIKQYDISKLEEDIALVKQLITCLDLEKEITTLEFFHQMNESPQNLNILDTCIYYLRVVHNYCFYSAAEFQDQRTLALKCSNIIFRLQNGNNNESNKAIILARKVANARIKQSQKSKDFDMDYNTLITKDYIKLRNFQSQNADINVFQCEYCEKQFQGGNYLQKHISVKHQIEFEILTYSTQIANLADEEKEMFIAYIQDIQNKTSFEDFAKEANDEDFNLPVNFLPQKFNKPNYRDLDNVQVSEKLGKPISPKDEITSQSINYNDI